jgi:hypothetical protein
VAGLGALALAQSWIYRLSAPLLPFLMSIFKRKGWIAWAPYPLSRWTQFRPLPAFKGGFRAWWDKRSAEGQEKN